VALIADFLQLGPALRAPHTDFSSLFYFTSKRIGSKPFRSSFTRLILALRASQKGKTCPSVQVSGVAACFDARSTRWVDWLDFYPGGQNFLDNPLDKRVVIPYNRGMAKYDSLRKTNRNKALLEYRKTHPEASLAEIGEVFGISAQRVWELLKIMEKDEKAATKTAA